MNRYKAYLRKRPHFGEMINEIEVNQPKIKYPDRRATFLRNTHYLSQFDGDNSFINLEEQESNMAKEQFLQQELRRMARETGETHMGLLASRGSSTASSTSTDSDSQQRPVMSSQAFQMPDPNWGAMDDIDGEQHRRDVQDNSRRFFMSKRARDKLRSTNSSDSDIMKYARATALSDTEVVEEAGSSNALQNYALRPTVRALRNLFNLKTETPKSPEEDVKRQYKQQEEVRKRLRQKTPPPRKK